MTFIKYTLTHVFVLYVRYATEPPSRIYKSDDNLFNYTNYMEGDVGEMP